MLWTLSVHNNSNGIGPYPFTEYDPFLWTPMPVDFLSETQRAAYTAGTPESRRPSNSLGTFISTPTGNCASYGTRTLDLRRSGCSRSEALSVRSCSIATQTPCWR